MICSIKCLPIVIIIPKTSFSAVEFVSFFCTATKVFHSKRIFRDRGRESSLQVANQSSNNAIEYISGQQDMKQIDTETTSLHDVDSESSSHRPSVNDDTDPMHSRDRVADSRINRAFQPRSSSRDVLWTAGESKHSNIVSPKSVFLPARYCKKMTTTILLAGLHYSSNCATAHDRALRPQPAPARPHYRIL